MMFGNDQTFADWIKVPSNNLISFDIQTTALQIKTDSEPGSGEMMKVRFFRDGEETAPSIHIHFLSKVSFFFGGDCDEGKTTIEQKLPAAIDGAIVWTIAKNGNIISLHGNGKKINKFSTTEKCKKIWSRGSDSIRFWDQKLVNKATDEYRKRPTSTYVVRRNLLIITFN